MKNMTKLMLIGVMSVLVPAAAGAQSPKPVPPVPPVPAVAPTPKVRPTIVIPELADVYALDAQEMKMRAMEAAQAAQSMNKEQIQAITEAGRKAADEARAKMDEMRAERPFLFDTSFKMNFDQQFATTYSSDSERSFYDRGQSALPPDHQDGASRQAYRQFFG